MNTMISVGKKEGNLTLIRHIDTSKITLKINKNKKRIWLCENSDVAIDTMIRLQNN